MKGPHSHLVSLIAAMLSLFMVGCDDDCSCPSCCDCSDWRVEQEIILRDFEYAQGRVFDIGRLGPDSVRLGDSVVEFYLYQAAAPSSNPADQATHASIYVSPSDTNYLHDESISPAITVEAVDLAKYAWYAGASDRPWVVMDEASHYLALGYWMRVWRYDTQTVDEIGDLDNDTVTLKLLWPGAIRANDALATWPLMWRNVYSIPKGISAGELDMEIGKGLPGLENETTSLTYQMNIVGTSQGPYLEILGLDQYNRIDQKLPDGQLDDRVEVYRPDWGLLMFPHRTPFDTDTNFVDASGGRTALLRELVPEIYTSRSENQKIADSKYFLCIVYYLYPEAPPGPI